MSAPGSSRLPTEYWELWRLHGNVYNWLSKHCISAMTCKSCETSSRQASITMVTWCCDSVPRCGYLTLQVVKILLATASNIVVIPVLVMLVPFATSSCQHRQHHHHQRHRYNPHHHHHHHHQHLRRCCCFCPDVQWSL